MQSNRSIPDCQVIPELAYPDVAEAAAWLCDTFGFSERMRIANHRIQLTFGTGAVVVKAAAAGVLSSAGATFAVMVRVENVDEHFARTQKAGARVLGVPTTYPFGERQYAATDPAGYRWVFTQSVKDVHPSEWGGLMVGEER